MTRPRRGGGTKRNAVLVIVGVLLMVVGGTVLGRALVDSGQAASSAGGRATAIPAGVGTQVPGPVGLPTAAPLAGSVPVRIEIPALRVSAPIMRLGLDTRGAVQVPPLASHNLAGWYDGSVTPGQDGSSVILGHVDSDTGISVFFYIKTLHPGNEIKIIRADRSIAVFAVDGVQKARKATFPSASVYENTRYPALRLVTCGGPFNYSDRQYLDNIIVYAHLVSSAVA
ncbi:MAG TPA: class F sortase [Streptosporangiaceae bacterium]